jgi:cytochrome b subunit of formate dehydrogenase
MLLILLATCASAWAQSTPPAENRRCLNCHGQVHLGELPAAERESMVAPASRPVGARVAAPPVRPNLYLPPEALAVGVHASLRCTDCHRDAEQLPHAQRLNPANCNQQCHTKQDAEVLRGAHAEALARNDPRAPRCATCHGDHGILRSRDRQSLTHPLNLIKVCASCHQQHNTPTPAGHEAGEFIAAYLDSVHGRAISQSGLIVAASCADCHGHHEVQPSNRPQSKVHREQIPQTCGRCHEGISETYKDSIHGQMMIKGDSRAPVCTDCHAAHAITRASTPDFMLDIVEECGNCHNEPSVGGARKSSLYETYRLSYHGQVTNLGYTRAARCSDCHGAHDIRPISDPLSRLHPDNRIEACRSCHPGANASFVQFEPHADHRDGQRYPLLHGVWLYFLIVMSGAFGFFGLHCVLWFIRSMIERVRHGPPPRHPVGRYAIMRFTRFDRINHVFVIISFFGLTLTGIPLLFSDERWAKWLAGMLGGVNSAGILHRGFGVMLLINFAAHVYGLFRRCRMFKRNGGPHRSILRDWLFGPSSMLPRVKDVKDCLGMFRWFFFGGHKPSFDRWTYWEKFDYVAEVFGSLVIGGSGLMLWFPVFFSEFLPGWAFNVAMIVHGYEALLAVGFIFTIHFFNAHLRMEKFPVDDVIFTGRLSEEEFIHERGVEYARLVAQGELDDLKVPPAAPWQRKAAVLVGVVAMGIGTTLVVLIILAGLGVL